MEIEACHVLIKDFLTLQLSALIKVEECLVAQVLGEQTAVNLKCARFVSLLPIAAKEQTYIAAFGQRLGGAKAQCESSIPVVQSEA